MEVKKTASEIRSPTGTDWFRVTVGARQGCNLSPYLFNFLLEAIMQHAIAETEAGVKIGGEMVNNLRFADESASASLCDQNTNLYELTRIWDFTTDLMFLNSRVSQVQETAKIS